MPPQIVESVCGRGKSLSMTAFTASVFLWIVLAFAANGGATPVTIDILSATYLTTLTNELEPVGGKTTTETRTTPSADPIKDFMQLDPKGHPLLSAKAVADVFGVSTYTIAHSVPAGDRVVATALASTQLFFAALADVHTTIGIDFLGLGEAFFSDGRVSLFDVTANTQAWSYGWTCCRLSSGNVPFVRQPDGSVVATLAADTSLSSGHTYRFDLMTQTYANFDEQGMSIQVSGLQDVPEPSTLFLLGCGLLVLTIIGMGRDGRRYLRPAPWS